MYTITAWNIQNVVLQAISMDLKRPSWKYVVCPGLYVQFNSFPKMCWRAAWCYSACGDSDSESPLILKLLLFLEMALCSGWCGLSMTDKTPFSLHPSATVVRQSSSNWSLRSSLSLVCSGVLRPSWGCSQHTTVYRKASAGSSVGAFCRCCKMPVFSGLDEFLC